MGFIKTEVDERLQAALRDLGYARVRKNIFRAPWSSGVVDHLIDFYWTHRFGQEEAVQVGVGFRHHEAQAFAATMWHDFGNLATRDVWKVGPTDCLVGFPLGKLCCWPLFSVFLRDRGAEGSVRQIIDALERSLRPIVNSIGDDAAMYAFLTQAENEAQWPANGAVRAAEAIFLGKRLGYPLGKVLPEVELFRGYIGACIDRGVTVDEYLSQVWGRA